MSVKPPVLSVVELATGKWVAIASLITALSGTSEVGTAIARQTNAMMRANGRVNLNACISSVAQLTRGWRRGKVATHFIHQGEGSWDRDRFLPQGKGHTGLGKCKSRPRFASYHGFPCWNAHNLKAHLPSTFFSLIFSKNRHPGLIWTYEKQANLSKG